MRGRRPQLKIRTNKNEASRSHFYHQNKCNCTFFLNHTNTQYSTITRSKLKQLRKYETEKAGWEEGEVRHEIGNHYIRPHNEQVGNQKEV